MEIRSMNIEIPDIIGFMVGKPATFLIECKTSRADFTADSSKPFRQYPIMGMGTYRSYLCEPGVIEVKDLPEKWGLLYIENDKIRWVHGYKHNAWSSNDKFVFPKNLQAEWHMLGSAVRRMQVRNHLHEIYEGIPDGFYNGGYDPTGDFQELQINIANWSNATFGPGQRTEGMIAHLLKEVQELHEEPNDLEEYADCLMLLIDAAYSVGFDMKKLLKATQKKLEINKKRKWGPQNQDGSIEHVR